MPLWMFRSNHPLDQFERALISCDREKIGVLGTHSCASTGDLKFRQFNISLGDCFGRIRLRARIRFGSNSGGLYLKVKFF